MNSSRPIQHASAGNVRHPERGRRYSIEELRELADQGDAWALGRVDQWELEFGNQYAGTLSERCEDPACERYGEPVDMCCDADGTLLDVDHGSWGHGLGWARAA